MAVNKIVFTFLLITSAIPTVNSEVKNSQTSSEKNLLSLPQCLSSIVDYRSQSDSLSRLLFPQVDDFQQCIHLDLQHDQKRLSGRKFCLAKLRFPFDVSLGPDLPKQLRVSLSVGYCLPESCAASHFESLGALFCHLPSCSVLEEASGLQSVCAEFQQLFCDPSDRKISIREVQLTCARGNLEPTLEEYPYSDISEANYDKESLNEDGFDVWGQLKNALVEQSADFATIFRVGDWISALSLFLPKTSLYSDIERDISFSQMNSFLTCGVTSLTNLDLIMSSGGVNQLGDYFGCTHEKNKIYEREGLAGDRKYCTFRYMKMASSGRCLSSECSESDLFNSMNWICDSMKSVDELSLRDSATGNVVLNPSPLLRNNFRETCLDYANIIPTDFCLQTELVGCGNVRIANELVRGASPIEVVMGLLDLSQDNYLSSSRYSKNRIVKKSIRYDESFLKMDKENHFFLRYSGQQNESLRSSESDETVAYSIQQVDKLSEILTTRGSSPLVSNLLSLVDFSSSSFLKSLNNEDEFSSVKRSLISSLSDSRFPFSPNVQSLQKNTDSDFNPSLTTHATEVYCEMHQASLKSTSFLVTIGMLSVFGAILPFIGWVAHCLKMKLETAETDERELESDLLKQEQNSKSLAPTKEEWVKKEESMMDKMVRYGEMFYITNNVKKLIHPPEVQRVAHFEHVCGIRVVSMAWIVLGHTLSFQGTSSTVANTPEVLNSMHKLTMQLISSGQFAVDTFFFLSGFFTVFNGCKGFSATLHSADSKSILRKVQISLSTFGMAVLKRYIRLSGLYFFLLAFHVHGFQFLSSGPNWPVIQNTIHKGTYGGCDAHLPLNLFYVNNLYPRVGSLDCFGWAWYLANDFQFYIIGCVLLIIRHYSKKSFKMISGMIFTASVVASFFVIVHLKLRINLLLLSAGDDSLTKNSLGRMQTVMDDYYTKPWNRFPAYGIGMFLALTCLDPFWLYTKLQPKQKSLTSSLEVKESMSTALKETETDLSSDFESDSEDSAAEMSPAFGDHKIIRMGHYSKDSVFCGHFLAFFTMLFIIFIQWTAYREGGETSWPRLLEVTYLALSRSLWVVCIGWFVVSLAAVGNDKMAKDSIEMRQKIIPFINDWLSRMIKQILSFRILMILSNLTFAVYLVHPIIQEWISASSTQPLWLSERRSYFEATGYVSICFIVGAVLVVLVEMTISSVAKRLGI